MFTTKEFEELVKIIRYEELSVLFVEAGEYYKTEGVKNWIIDKDNCFIY